MSGCKFTCYDTVSSYCNWMELRPLYSIRASAQTTFDWNRTLRRSCFHFSILQLFTESHNVLLDSDFSRKSMLRLEDDLFSKTGRETKMKCSKYNCRNALFVISLYDICIRIFSGVACGKTCCWCNILSGEFWVKTNDKPMQASRNQKCNPSRPVERGDRSIFSKT